MKGVRGVKGVPRMGGTSRCHAVKHEKLALRLIPLEVAGLGGELMATKILHGDTKKKGSLVKKSAGPTLLNNVQGVADQGQRHRAVITSPKARKKGMEYTKKGAGSAEEAPEQGDHHQQGREVRRRDRRDLGGARSPRPTPTSSRSSAGPSVVEVNGEPVVDLQGDYISVDEMEKAGYEYVMKSRKGGDMHLRDDWSPIQKSRDDRELHRHPGEARRDGSPGLGAHRLVGRVPGPGPRGLVQGEVR